MSFSESLARKVYCIHGALTFVLLDVPCSLIGKSKDHTLRRGSVGDSVKCRIPVLEVNEMLSRVSKERTRL